MKFETLCALAKCLPRKSFYAVDVVFYSISSALINEKLSTKNSPAFHKNNCNEIEQFYSKHRVSFLLPRTVPGRRIFDCFNIFRLLPRRSSVAHFMYAFLKSEKLFSATEKQKQPHTQKICA